MAIRVGFLTTHPIQYQVPIFRRLAQAEGIDFTVCYCQIPDAAQQGAGFGVDFQWDIPLLEGYEHCVLQNVARQPSVTSFRGCDTPGIKQEIRQRKFDALIVNGWVVRSCLQGLRACRQLGIPCLVRGEANLLRPRAWWKHWLHRRLLHRYAAYLYIGQANRAFYEYHGVPATNLFAAPYCIENERFERAAESSQLRREQLRRVWSISPEEMCFLYCGKFEAKKHPLELLQCFREAVSRGATTRLLMVGDGDLKPACQAFVKEHRLPVTFTGFLNQSQIVDAYVAADVLVLPSDHGETWGLVVNEAMACGRPAIVSDQVGCTSDLIVEGETGCVFPFGDWQRLSELLVKVSGSPSQVHTMGHACRTMVQKYSPLAAADGIAQAVHFVNSQSRETRFPSEALRS